jgi:hypothetical protein
MLANLVFFGHKWSNLSAMRCISFLALTMSQYTPKQCDSLIDQETASSVDSDTALSSPMDRSSLPLAHLVPSNSPARLAISRAREEGSTYHSNFITNIEYRGCPSTPCFELALGGLPEHSGVSWRIGRGCNEFEHKGVDFLLVTDDDGIATRHASFGWTVYGPGLRLIVLNKEHKICTINGRDFNYGNLDIPLENTILIGDCAFTLLFTPRTCAVEALFQSELRKCVLRLIELEGGEEIDNAALIILPRNKQKRCRSVDCAEGMSEDDGDARFRKRPNGGASRLDSRSSSV